MRALAKYYFHSCHEFAVTPDFDSVEFQAFF